MKISAGFHSSLAFPSLTCRNGEMGICECEGGFEYMRMRDSHWEWCRLNCSKGRHLHNHILCCTFCHYFFTTIILCCKKLVFWIFLARSGVRVNSGQSPQHICIIMSITITPCSCGHDWHHLFHRHYFCHSIVTSHNHHFRHRLLRENAGVQDELHVSRVNRFISGWLWDGMWSVPNIVKEYRLSNI